MIVAPPNSCEGALGKCSSQKNIVPDHFISLCFSKMSQQATSRFKVRSETNLVGSLVGVALAPLQELPLLSRLL